jgi:tight adherence protein B
VSRRACLAAAVAAVATLGSLGGAATAQEVEPAAIELTSVDTASFPSVTAVVTVDPGVAGVDLPAEAFDVLEDGEPMAAQVARMPTSNLELVLALDTSGSMEGEPLAAAQQAATDFLTALPADVPVAVVGFGPEPALLAGTSTDRSVQADTLAGLTASGETALYDAVIHATQQFSTPATDRVVVLLSDGGDTSSAAALEAAEAAAAGVTLYVIDLVTPESNPDALARLAAAGHGTVSSAVDPTALDGLYQAAARALVNRYQVDYTSDATGTVDLTVRLTTEGGTVSATQPVEMPVSPTAPTGGPTAGETAAKVGSPGPAPERSGPHRGLLVGAVAMFLALLTIGLVVVPARDRPPRPVTNLLPVPAPPPDRPTPSQLTQRVTDATEAFLERRGRQQGLAAALDVAGISLRTGELVVLVVVVTVIGALAGLAVAGLLGFLLAAGIPLVAWATVNMLADRRRERFAEQLPDNLQLLTSSLRSGHSLLHALDTLAREAPEPARAEFRRVLLETRVGRDPGDALSAVADRMGSDDFTWVVGAIEINREVGGDLPATLDSVADTIRERQRVHRQIKALTAEGRISGYVLTGLPPVLALVMAAVNPGYFSRLASGGGLALLMVGAVLLVIGWIWMRRLGRLDF